MAGNLWEEFDQQDIKKAVCITGGNQATGNLADIEQFSNSTYVDVVDDFRSWIMNNGISMNDYVIHYVSPVYYDNTVAPPIYHIFCMYNRYNAV